jgi:hypothetical protein
MVAAPGNRNEALSFMEALPQLTSMAKKVGLDQNETIVSLDRSLLNSAFSYSLKAETAWVRYFLLNGTCVPFEFSGSSAESKS